MKLSGFLLAVALSAVPVSSQPIPAANPRLEKGELHWFLLGETKAEIAKAMGQPRLAANFGADFESWQYQIDVADQDDFSHQFVFRTSTRELISVTVNYDPERNVDELFPAAETVVYAYSNGTEPRYKVRLRRLRGGRVLLAPGSSKPGQTAGQLVLIREAELRYFYPWLFEQLRTTAAN